MSALGEMLKEFRERRVMSQRQLAQQADVDTSYISKIESGDREYPSRALILRIAEILQLTSQELMVMLMSAGYVSPRIQKMATSGNRQLIELVKILDNFDAEEN